MKQTNRKGIPFWEFNSLSGYHKIDHYVSTRHGGFSSAPYGNFNLSLTSGENTSVVGKNRLLLADALQTRKQFIYFPKQCHTNHVREITTSTVCSDLDETDALVTNLPGKYLCVLVADCVPVLIYDPVKKAIAAVHAGWRGTVAGIVRKTIETLMEKYGSDPVDMIAGIGPSISVKNYQVGPEVVEKVKNYYRNTSGIINHIDNKGKGFLDLWEANRKQLLIGGIPSDNIEISGLCTYDATEIFYSARRESFHSGRFACGICLRP